MKITRKKRGDKKERRVRRDVDEARNKVLNATLSIIEKHGWSGISFQMIAKKCEMSTSNIVYHFESRPRLLLALLEKISENNFNVVADGIRPEHNAYQRLINHFQKNLEWGQKFPQEAQVVIQIYLEAAHDKEFTPIFMKMIHTAQARIHEHILAGIREKLFIPTLDPLLSAKMLHNLLIGAFIYVVGSRQLNPIKYKTMEWESVLKTVLDYQGH